MNIFQRKTAALAMPVVAAIMLQLAACGGGGGGANPATPITINAEDSNSQYVPDESALSTKAATSDQLYVDPGFTFDTYKTISVDIAAIDSRGRPLANTLLFVSAIDSEITVYDDERLQQKALLTVTKTNADGRAQALIEAASSVSKVLL